MTVDLRKRTPKQLAEYLRELALDIEKDMEKLTVKILGLHEALHVLSQMEGLE